MKSIILILGKRGAGKTTIALELAQQHDGLHIEMSSYIKEIRRRDGFTKLRLRNFVEYVHDKKSKDYFVSELFNSKIQKSESALFLITGIRNPAEVNFFNSISLFNTKQIYLYLSFFERYKRVKLRGKRGSLYEFIKEEYYSMKWGNSKLESLSQIVHNKNLSISIQQCKKIIFDD